MLTPAELHSTDSTVSASQSSRNREPSFRPLWVGHEWYRHKRALPRAVALGFVQLLYILKKFALEGSGRVSRATEPHRSEGTCLVWRGIC